VKDLPEDFNLWPSDPFALLNVKRSDELKLIRKYKPDRFPAEFQKIREAYETVESWLKWHRHDDEPDELSNSQPDDSHSNVEAAQLVDEPAPVKPAGKSGSFDAAGEVSSTDTEFEAVGETAPRPQLSSPMDRFYESLNSTGLRSAVEHLKNVDTSDGMEQISQANLATYFIARLVPGSTGKSSLNQTSTTDYGILESDLKRLSWLLKSIRSAEHSPAALDQLRIELDENYLLANCNVFNRSLDKIDDYRTLASLYRIRWQAIGHYQPRTVVEDLKKLQPRSLDFGGYQGDWLSLLSESMSYTIWHQDERCLAHNDECWREISENDQSWTSDSVELLMLGADQWRMDVSFRWSAATPWARCTLPETSRAIWMPVAEEISTDPKGSLKTLNYHFQTSSMAMTLFEEGLQNLASLNTDSEGDADYRRNRIPMMEFCILNQMSPMTFAAAANSFLAPEENVGWFELVQSDGPLRCVVNACHATSW